MFKKQLKSKPVRMWIDGKCFDIGSYNRKNNSKSKQAVSTQKEPEGGVEIENVQETTDTIHVESVFVKEELRIGKPIDTSSVFHVTQNETGKFFTSFRLPKLYYNKLATFYKYEIEKLSDKTSTEINVPKKNEEHLTINGSSKEKLIEASSEVLSVIGQIREQNMALQFISIPCISEEIKENFEKFKSEILNGEVVEGMDESIFQKPEKLHLTINVFVLLDERETSEAILALKDYEKNILRPLIAKTGPLKIHVSGVECMNENLKKVDVLYAKARICDENDDKNLQKIADGIQDHFYQRGLAKNYKETVKLHMTLINTKYRKDGTESPNKNAPSPKKRRWTKRQSFDATKIMDKYKDFDFGQCDMDSIHLSLMGSVDEDSGFYKPLSVVKLNYSKSPVVSDEIIEID